MRAEALGKLVRSAWCSWAARQPEPKPSWLQPWEMLTEPEREVDREIGLAVQDAARSECHALIRQFASEKLGAKAMEHPGVVLDELLRYMDFSQEGT